MTFVLILFHAMRWYLSHKNFQALGSAGCEALVSIPQSMNFSLAGQGNLGKYN